MSSHDVPDFCQSLRSFGKSKWWLLRMRERSGVEITALKHINLNLNVRLIKLIQVASAITRTTDASCLPEEHTVAQWILEEALAAL